MESFCANKVCQFCKKSVTLQSNEAKSKTIMIYNSKRSFFHFLLASLLCASMQMMAQDVLDPVPDPAAVVTSGNARFTVLTSRMIRIQYSQTAQFEDRATFAIVARKTSSSATKLAPSSRKPTRSPTTSRSLSSSQDAPSPGIPARTTSSTFSALTARSTPHGATMPEVSWRKDSSHAPDGASSTRVPLPSGAMEAPPTPSNPRTTA